jgi:hypothetical protein
MTAIARDRTPAALSPILPCENPAAPAPGALPALPPRAGALVPVDAGALVRRALAATGLEPFVRLARVHPTLVQGAALPIGALLVMCLALGGPPALVVGAYFLGCGMILSRKAVKTLLEQAPASGGQQPA